MATGVGRAADYGDWGVTQLFGQNKYYLVIITSTVYGSVQAWLPDQVEMQVNSHWQPVLASGPDALNSFTGNLLLGATLFSQYLTAQAWTGSDPLQLVLPLHFFAVKDSTDEVIRPIRNLMRMALPRKTGNKLLGLIPPGPRVDPGEFIKEYDPGNAIIGSLRVNRFPDNINVYVGNFLRLTKVFISSLDQITFKGRLSATSATDPGGLPMEGTCFVTFKTAYSATSNMMEQILLSGINRPPSDPSLGVRPDPMLK